MIAPLGTRRRRRRTRRNRLRLRAGVLLAGMALGMPLSAGGFWSGTSVPGGSGASAAGSVAQGATPATSVSGRAVTVTWAARTLSQGTAVSGYTVLRRDASTNAAQPVLSSCSGTVTALTCTEDAVPDGAWVYSVAPRFALWQGPEGLASSTVTISVPGAPTSVTATPRAAAAAVSWTAPSAGSSPITSYTATASPGGQTCTTATTTCSISGLTDDTAYTVTVTATSAIGTGPTSSAAAVTPRAAPGPPTAVSAPSGDGTSAVSWTAPAVVGGSAITSYTATATPANSSAATSTCTSESSPCTLALINGLTYAVSVTATNAYGTGPSSAAASTSPYPSGLLTASNLALWVDGDDPATLFSDAGCTSPATTGTVGCWKDRSGSGLDVSQATAANAMTVGSLNGRTALTSTSSTWYASSGTGTFRTVISVGSPSRSGGLATVFAAPANADFSQRLNAGQLPSAPNGNDWHNGGSGWTDGVTAGMTPASGAAIFVSQASSTQTGRTASISTSFQTRGFVGPLGEVLAFNRVLTTAERRSVEDYLARKWAAPLSPSAPASATAVAASTSVTAGQITAGWSAPTWDGGSAVTSYTATALPGGASCTSSGTTCTITGLSNGTSYTVGVSATNAIGGGPATAAAPVTPRSVPGVITTVHLAPQDSGTQVTWLAPDDGGSAISSYTATASPGGASCTTAATPCTISGLTNGETYTVTVTATNAVGTGAPSAGMTVVPGPAPGPPTGISAALSDDTATVSWTPPTDPGESPVRSYTTIAFPYRTSLPVLECNSTASPCTVTGLVYGVDYLFTVKATNDVGAGAAGLADHGTPAPDDLLTATNLAAWMDASTASTLYGGAGCTTAASSAVGCWKDRAGGALRFTQSTGANQPTLGTLNERTALMSTGTTWLTSSGSGTFRTIITAGSADRSAAWSTTFASSANSDFSQRLSNGSLVAHDGNDWGWGGSTWVSGAADGSQPATGAVLYESEAGASRTGTASISTSFLGRGFVGPIGEVLAFTRVLTASERRTVEEYLARKWGAVITPAAATSPSATRTGTGTATVSWTAPAWDGGAAVTSYVVTASTGTGTCTWTSGLTASCTGLTTGTSQSFSVVARNTQGAGPAASSENITP